MNPKDVWVKFTKFFSMCGGDKRFLAFACFVKHYGPVKFGPCARKIIHDLEHQSGDFGETFKQRLNALNKVFRAGLEIEGESLSDKDMYNYIKEVGFATYKFALDRMIDAGKALSREKSRLNDVQKLISNLHQAFHEIKVLSKANIVSIARDIGAIEERELTDKFRLINEYARLAAYILNEKRAIDIVKHFVYLDSDEYRIARMGGPQFRPEH